jgi:hypothetical protein
VVRQAQSRLALLRVGRCSGRRRGRGRRAVAGTGGWGRAHQHGGRACACAQVLGVHHGARAAGVEDLHALQQRGNQQGCASAAWSVRPRGTQQVRQASRASPCAPACAAATPRLCRYPAGALAGRRLRQLLPDPARLAAACHAGTGEARKARSLRRPLHPREAAPRARRATRPCCLNSQGRVRGGGSCAARPELHSPSSRCSFWIWCRPGAWCLPGQAASMWCAAARART